MTRLSSASPQFLVDDLAASIGYYTGTLGFEVNIQHADYYASVKRDDAEIHLKAAAKLLEERRLRLENEHIDAYIWVPDIASLHAEFAAAGALILHPPTLQPWGVRDFYVKDIDDYILCFGEQEPA